MRSRWPALGLAMMLYGATLALLGLSLWCSSPLMIMEGEELPVIVLGLLWGVGFLVSAVLLAVSGGMLRRRRGRPLALVALVVQVLVSACLCTMPSILLFAGGVWVLFFSRDPDDVFP